MTNVARTKSRVTLAVAVMCLLILSAAASFAAEPDDRPATIRAVDDFFDEMTDVLRGRWVGEYAHGTIDAPVGEWAQTAVEYTVTAGGTALIENYIGDSGDVYMSTVYNKDNNDLRATHYCGAKNHPRMVARSIDAGEKTVFFDFVDITNLESPESYHSRSLELRILDQDSIVVTFSGLQDGRESSRVFRFRRNKNAAAAD